MAVRSVPPPRLLLVLLFLAVAGGGWSQTLLDPESRTCRTKDNIAAATASQGRRNEYPAGGVLLVLANMPAGLFGSLEVYLCPDGEAKEECLDRVPLQLGDGYGSSYDLSKVPSTDDYEIPVILPDDVTCVTCTLQMRVLSRVCEDEEACPATEQVTCADLTIREIKYHEKRILGFLLGLVPRALKGAIGWFKKLRARKQKRALPQHALYWRGNGVSLPAVRTQEAHDSV